METACSGNPENIPGIVFILTKKPKFSAILHNRNRAITLSVNNISCDEMHFSKMRVRIICYRKPSNVYNETFLQVRTRD